MMFFRIHGVKKQLLVALCVYLGQMAAGYTMGWTAPTIPKLQDPVTSPLADQITEFQISLIGSVMYLGSLLGPYVTGYLANVKGRRPCMLLGGLILITAYVVLGTAKTLVTIYIGRILSGFGVGIIVVMALIYLGEIASTHIRGAFLTGIGIFLTGGTLLSFSVGPFVSYVVAAYVGIVLAFMYTISILWIPESPIYYALKKDKENSVKNILQDLGRINDIDDILSPTKEENSLKDWRELFYLKGNRKALVITIILNICQHGSGILAITFFATSIFKLAGANLKPELATIIIAFTQLCGGLITPMFVERTGRRILLLISTAICCLSLVIFILITLKKIRIYLLKALIICARIVKIWAKELGLGWLTERVSMK